MTRNPNWRRAQQVFRDWCARWDTVVDVELAEAADLVMRIEAALDKVVADREADFREASERASWVHIWPRIGGRA